jgi:hypothetical protein
VLICNCRTARRKYIERDSKLQNLYICFSFQNASTQFPAVVPSRPKRPLVILLDFLNKKYRVFLSRISGVQINMLLSAFFNKWEILSSYVEDQAHFF